MTQSSRGLAHLPTHHNQLQIVVELDDFGRQVRLRIVAENQRIQLSQARLVTTLNAFYYKSTIVRILTVFLNSVTFTVCMLSFEHTQNITQMITQPTILRCRVKVLTLKKFQQLEKNQVSHHQSYRHHPIYNAFYHKWCV